MTGEIVAHLTLADYQPMQWANGRGTTLEMVRKDGPDGLLWRLSIATVAEDGRFSLLPGIDRTLTVIDGPGFSLEGGGIRLAARPFLPICFPGEAPLAAINVAAPSMDFNVMTARNHYRHAVALARPGRLPGQSFLLALEAGRARVNDQTLGLARHDLLILHGPVTLGQAPKLLGIVLF